MSATMKDNIQGICHHNREIVHAEEVSSVLVYLAGTEARLRTNLCLRRAEAHSCWRNSRATCKGPILTSMLLPCRGRTFGLAPNSCVVCNLKSINGHRHGELRHIHIHGKQMQHEGQKEESTSSFLQHLIFPRSHALQSR